MSSISCVLPVYNAASFLPAWWARNGRELHEVDAELVVVDNGSEDTTIEEVRKFNYRRLQLIRHPFNLGSEESLKTAKKNVSGDYRILLPADDWLAPGYLREAMQALDANANVGVVYGKSFLVDLSTGSTRERLRPLRAKGPRKEDPFAALAFNNFVPDISLFRSKALNCDHGSTDWFMPGNQVGILKNFEVYYTASDQCFSGKHAGQLSKQWAASGRYYSFYTDMIIESRKLFASCSPEVVIWYLFFAHFHSGRTLLDLLGDVRNSSPYYAGVVEANYGEILKHVALLISDELAALGRVSSGKLGNDIELREIIRALPDGAVNTLRETIAGLSYEPQF